MTEPAKTWPTLEEDVSQPVNLAESMEHLTRYRNQWRDRLAQFKIDLRESLRDPEINAAIREAVKDEARSE